MWSKVLIQNNFEIIKLTFIEEVYFPTDQNILFNFRYFSVLKCANPCRFIKTAVYGLCLIIISEVSVVIHVCYTIFIISGACPFSLITSSIHHENFPKIKWKRLSTFPPQYFWQRWFLNGNLLEAVNSPRVSFHFIASEMHFPKIHLVLMDVLWIVDGKICLRARLIFLIL